jgi:hypothetical protein
VEEWMVEHGGLDEEKTKTPSRQELSEWVIKSLGTIGTKIVRNSWRRNGFSYFPDEMELDDDGFDDVDINDAAASDDAAANDDDDEEEDDEWLFCTDYVSGQLKQIVLTPPAKTNDQTDSIEQENEENEENDSSDSDEDN